MDVLSEALNEPLSGRGPVLVMGHTDSISDDQYNLELSQRRAETVEAALLSRAGGLSVEAVGYGESQPVAANEINGVDRDVVLRALHGELVDIIHVEDVVVPYEP